METEYGNSRFFKSEVTDEEIRCWCLADFQHVQKNLADLEGIEPEIIIRRDPFFRPQYQTVGGWLAVIRSDTITLSEGEEVQAGDITHPCPNSWSPGPTVTNG